MSTIPYADGEAFGNTTGFPSPASDHMEPTLDLHKHLIKNPDATFFLKMKGEAMKNFGIQAEAILIVDRARKATSGNIVVGLVENELIVRKWIKLPVGIKLIPGNNSFNELVLKRDEQCEIWGVVSYAINPY